MSDLNKIKIIQSLSKLYLSLFAINYVAGKPAEKTSDAKTEKTEKTDTSDSKTDASTTKKPETTDEKTDTTANKTESGSTGVSQIPSLNQRTKCKPNTQSCDEGFSCIRFNADGEDNFSCIKTELSFCDSEKECKDKLGSNFKYCYRPPWAEPNARKQCFTEQTVGSHCLYNIHCVNNLSCVDQICVSSSAGDLEDTSSTNGMNFDTKQKNDGTILGINKWIFISAVSFPVIVFLLCTWCWLIGRSSSKRIESKKKEKYEKELKELTIPGQKKEKNGSEVSSSTHQSYVNPQKEIEEEVGKRGFRSLFSKKKKEDDVEEVEEKDNDEKDISTSKVGGKPPINTTTTTDTQQKMKNNLTLSNIDKNGARPRKNAGMKSPSTPASSVASYANSTTSSAQGKRVKKKAAGAAGTSAGKKTKKTANTDTSNSTSSKQSSQRGLVNNASNMSSALSGQSASYFSTVSSLDPQSALYYQQMYAQAAAAQNPYYASYMQNPYYAAAAQAAAAQSAAYYGQDPTAMYNYQNQTGYQ